MTFERITEKNICFAVQVQSELFPGESAWTNYEESLEETSGYEYYLIFEGGDCIGIIGLYSFSDDPDSAWLGWFGIRENYRRRHFGTAALKKFEETAAARGFRFARLYTDAENNDTAIRFYKANGYLSEPYRNSRDPACMKYKTLICSKSLSDEKLIPWGNRNIHLTEQIAKQEMKRQGRFRKTSDESTEFRLY